MLRLTASRNILTRCAGAGSAARTAIAGRRYASSTDNAASNPSSSVANPAATVEAVKNQDVLAKEKALEDEARMDVTSPIRPEGDAIAAAIVSGAPPELFKRPVRIYRPAADTTQSADRASKNWYLDWDSLSSGGRWENHLVGWASSADMMQGTSLKFKTKEQAVAHAEKNGWPYFIQSPHAPAYTPKSYANNFAYSSGRIRYVRTK